MQSNEEKMEKKLLVDGEREREKDSTLKLNQFSPLKSKLKLYLCGGIVSLTFLGLFFFGIGKMEIEMGRRSHDKLAFTSF